MNIRRRTAAGMEASGAIVSDETDRILRVTGHMVNGMAGSIRTDITDSTENVV
jgi:hypothetical protein